MPVRISQFRPIAIALVLQDDDGNLQIIGSKSLTSSTIEELRHPDSSPFISSRFDPYPSSFRIEADCRSVVWQHATPVPMPRQIEQRGIYLPDMSFRALPGPDEA